MTIDWFCARCDRLLDPPRIARLCPACARDENDARTVIMGAALEGYRMGIDHAVKVLGVIADDLDDHSPSEAITAAMALIRDQEATFITAQEAK